MLIFVAILAFSGLLSRRWAEAALLVGAIAFMAIRLLSHWRLGRRYKSVLASVKAIADGGEGARLIVDEDRVSLASALALRQCPFEGARIEDAGDMIYVWPRKGDALAIPARAFAGLGEAERFMAFARRRIVDRGSTASPSRTT